MKWILLFLLILVIFQSCKNETKTSCLTIEKSKDTISVAEEITVNLHIEEYEKSREPSFHILHKGNDYNIPFDNKIRCGVFKAIGRKEKEGNNIWNGYVEYFDTMGNLKKEEFSFSYFVK